LLTRGNRRFPFHSPVDCGSPPVLMAATHLFLPKGKNANDSLRVIFPYGNRRGRPDRREGKKPAGGRFFSPGEIPFNRGCIPQGCGHGLKTAWQEALFSGYMSVFFCSRTGHNMISKNANDSLRITIVKKPTRFFLNVISSQKNFPSLDKLFSKRIQGG